MMTCWQWTKDTYMVICLQREGLLDVKLLYVHNKHIKMSLCGLWHCHITALLSVSWNNKW